MSQSLSAAQWALVKTAQGKKRAKEALTKQGYFGAGKPAKVSS